MCDKRLEQLNLTFLENGNVGVGWEDKVHVVVYVLARCVFVCGGRS